jgi:nitrate reductase / nitrite oxidoreductase, alpha subunit
VHGTQFAHAGWIEGGSNGRRRFLQLAAMAGLGTVANPGDLLAQYRFLDPVRVANPLAEYPNRDWERLYRDIFRHDRTFTFLCAPNGTNNCLLRAFVKNNVLVAEPEARPEDTCDEEP